MKENSEIHVHKTKRRLLRHPKPDEPLVHPLHYFGWTMDLAVRIKHHQRHQKSNCVRGLMHAALMHLFDISPMERRGFTMYGFPISFLTKSAQSCMAEIMFTVLGNAGMDGFGFNAKPSGLNNDSANKVAREFWAGNCQCVMMIKTPIELNIANGGKHLNAYVPKPGKKGHHEQGPGTA